MVIIKEKAGKHKQGKKGWKHPEETFKNKQIKINKKKRKNIAVRCSRYMSTEKRTL